MYPKQILINFFLLFFLINCSAPNNEPTIETVEPTKIIRVGVLAPLTGPSAGSGEEIKNGVLMAFSELNFKAADYTIEPVWIDSKSDPDFASRAYETAILEDKIDVGLLNWHSSVAIAVMEINAKHKIPHFFGLAGTDLIGKKINGNPEKYNYWSFKGWPDISQLTTNYVTALEEQLINGNWPLTEKKAAILIEDSDWGQSFAQAMNNSLKENGWTVLSPKFVAAEEEQFTPLLQELKEENIALLISSGTATNFYPQLLKQATNINLPALIIADGLGWQGNWYELSGNSSNYVIDQIPGWTTDEAKAFVTRYENQWGSKPSPSAAGLSYDYARFFLEIIEEASKNYETLNATTIYQFGQDQVATGKLTFTDGIIMQEYKYLPENRPNPVVGDQFYTFPVLQYHSGTPYIIWPEKWQERPFTIKTHP